MSQRGGALLALAELGHLGFGLTLLEEMWPEERVTPHAAIWLINKALQTHQRELQDHGAAILRDNASRLALPKGDYCWPSCIDWHWKNELSVEARECLLRALVSLLPSHAKSKWDSDSLIGVLINLDCIRSDSDPAISAGATRAAFVLVEELEKQGFKDIELPRGYTLISELRKQLEDDVKRIDASPENDASWTVLEGIRRLKEEWS